MDADLFCNVLETTLHPFIIIIIIIIKVPSNFSCRIMTWSTHVGEHKLSSGRKKINWWRTPPEEFRPQAHGNLVAWTQVLLRVKSKTLQEAGALKLYKEVLGEEGHVGEACKIHRSCFAKGCSRCWIKILQTTLLGATAPCPPNSLLRIYRRVKNYQHAGFFGFCFWFNLNDLRQNY